MVTVWTNKMKSLVFGSKPVFKIWPFLLAHNTKHLEYTIYVEKGSKKHYCILQTTMGTNTPVARANVKSNSISAYPFKATKVTKTTCKQ